MTVTIKQSAMLPNYFDALDGRVDAKPSEHLLGVIADLKARELKGIMTYGVTMDRGDLSLPEWLQHAYEETLDKALYIKKAIEILKGECSRKSNVHGT
jgi:hypothetical protein